MCLWPSWLNTMQQWSDLRLIFVPKTKLTEPKIEQGTQNEIQMLMKWHAPVYRVKRYIVLCRHPLNLLSSLPDKHIPGAHVNVALIQMGLVSHPVKAEMSPDGWTLLWGAVDGVSSGLYGSSQAWLDPFHTEGPWRSLSITLGLLGYSWARTFTSVLLFLPSVKLVVQRAVFSETVILMAGLDWLIDWLHIYTQQRESWDGLLSPTLPLYHRCRSPQHLDQLHTLTSDHIQTHILNSSVYGVMAFSTVYVLRINAAAAEGKMAFHE